MRLNALYVLDDNAYEMVYGGKIREEIAQLVDVIGPQRRTKDQVGNEELLSQAQILISGWGAPRLDREFLTAAPKLEAVFYGAGSVGQVMTDAAWDKGIVITSANSANAIPVAEYSLATILFSLKHGWRLARKTRELRTFPGRDGAPGCFGTTVGLVSLGMIARKLLHFLKPFDLKVIVYDPYISEAEAQRLGVSLVSLEELFAISDVVSIHTPSLPETAGMIDGRLIESMKDGATLINTARGEIVREIELIEIASRRDDLQFVLDVTDGEPPKADSPLYTLPNVTLTPHIAGSVGEECKRMGECMVDEIQRYVKGEPLQLQVRRELAVRSTHRPVTVSVRKSKVRVPRLVEK